MRHNERRFVMPCFPVFCLGIALAFLSASPVLAGQDITIDSVVSDSVYGNGDKLNNGAWSTGDPDDLEDPDSNTVTVISNGRVNDDDVYGGYAKSESDEVTVSHNSVFIDGGEVIGTIYGGSAYRDGNGDATATASYNNVTINSGSAMNIYGGTVDSSASDSGSSTVSYNNVTINGGLVDGSVSGGTVWGTIAATASYNNVTISGGRVTGSIYGGEANASDSKATHNTVTISGNPTFKPSATILYGGQVDSNGDVFTGNTLNLHSSIYVNGVRNFQYLNFYLPTTLKAGDTMLTIGKDGEANISGSIVNVGIDGASTPLVANDTVILIDASEGTLTEESPVNTKASGQGMQGVTLKYDFAITTANNQLLAKVLGKPVVNEKAEALPEGFLADLILINQGADLVAGQGIGNAVGGATTGFGTFAALSGGWSRYGSGSHVDMSSQSLMTGLAWGADTTPGRLTLGAFFEYGHGSYDTGHSFSATESVIGDGDVHHFGGGILGRMDFRDIWAGHFYAEASGRAGGVHNEYGSSDLLDAMGRSAKFDSSTAYHGLHLGGGYLWDIGEKASLDLYGKYFWSHVNSNSVTLSTGDPMHFDSADSSRLRIGGRFAYTVDEYITPYMGAAYEHEFNGKLRASAHGYGIGEPSLRGGTGMAETGLILKPSRNLPLSFDFGMRVYTGKRDGAIGTLRIKFDF